MLSVRSVNTKSDLKKFIEYPYKKYRSHPHWVPPLRMSEREKFDPSKNPFFEHGRMKLFLAERDGEVVGRVAGIDDDLHNETHRDNVAFFGFFEAVDEAVAHALFTEVEAWAGSLSRSSLRGPVNPTMNDGAGFQINAFDADPFIMMPYNPPEYPSFAEAAGYHKIKDLYAWYLGSDVGPSDRLLRLADRAAKRYNFTIRPLEIKHFKDEVERVLGFYNEVWEKNWGQTKYTPKEAELLAKELKLIVDPEMVLILEIDGELAGIAVGFPDANQLFKKMNGRLLPFGIFYALRAKHIINRLRLPILGVRPEYRNKGLELALIAEFCRRGIARGYTGAECSWILEDNEAMNKGIAATGAELYKVYRLYQKELE